MFYINVEFFLDLNTFPRLLQGSLKANLLLQSSKAHVTRAVLELCLAFSKYLSNLHNGVPLLKQLCDHVLLNPAIWIHIPAQVKLLILINKVSSGVLIWES